VTTLSDKRRDCAESTLLAFIIPPSYGIKFHWPLAAAPLCLVPEMATSLQAGLAPNWVFTEWNGQARTMSTLVQGDAMSVSNQ